MPSGVGTQRRTVFMPGPTSRMSMQTVCWPLATGTVIVKPGVRPVLYFLVTAALARLVVTVGLIRLPSTRLAIWTLALRVPWSKAQPVNFTPAGRVDDRGDVAGGVLGAGRVGRGRGGQREGGGAQGGDREGGDAGAGPDRAEGGEAGTHGWGPFGGSMVRFPHGMCCCAPRRQTTRNPTRI